MIAAIIAAVAAVFALQNGVQMRLLSWTLSPLTAGALAVLRSRMRHLEGLLSSLAAFVAGGRARRGS
jgi:hypothetical protein